MRARWPFADWSHFFVYLPQSAVRLWHRWRRALPSGSYRPERHYMRGHGPKSLRRRP
jgi:hypothetical protein